MPLYEYRCTECGNRYEKIQKINDLQDTACPKCGGKVFRPLTAPAFQFKGSGWFVNDYASKSSGGPSGSSSRESTGESSRDAAKESSDKPSAAESSKPAAAETKTPSAGSGSSSGTPAS